MDYKALSNSNTLLIGINTFLPNTCRIGELKLYVKLIFVATLAKYFEVFFSIIRGFRLIYYFLG